MKRKLFFFLSLLFAGVGTICAETGDQITDLANLSNTKVYKICTSASGSSASRGYLKGDLTSTAGTAVTSDNAGTFAFIKDIWGRYMLYSSGQKKFISKTGTLTDTPDFFTITASSGVSGTFIIASEATTYYMQLGGSNQLVLNTDWKTLDNGNQWLIYEAEDTNYDITAVDFSKLDYYAPLTDSKGAAVAETGNYFLFLPRRALNSGYGAFYLQGTNSSSKYIPLVAEASVPVLVGTDYVWQASKKGFNLVSEQTSNSTQGVALKNVGQGKYISFTSYSNGANSALLSQESADNAEAFGAFAVTNGDYSCFYLRTTGGKNIFSNNGGSGQGMGLWESTSDTGGHLQFVPAKEVAFAISAEGITAPEGGWTVTLNGGETNYATGTYYRLGEITSVSGNWNSADYNITYKVGETSYTETTFVTALNDASTTGTFTICLEENTLTDEQKAVIAEAKALYDECYALKEAGLLGAVGTKNVTETELALYGMAITSKDFSEIETAYENFKKIENVTLKHGNTYFIKSSGTGGYLYANTSSNVLYNSGRKYGTETIETFSADNDIFKWVYLEDGAEAKYPVLYNVGGKSFLKNTSAGTGTSAMQNWKLFSAASDILGMDLSLEQQEGTNIFCIRSLDYSTNASNNHYMNFNLGDWGYTGGLTNWGANTQNSGWYFVQVSEETNETAIAALSTLITAMKANYPFLQKMKGEDGWLLGEGLHEYSGVTADELDALDNAETEYDFMSKVATVRDKVVLNSPKAGTFLRLQCNGTGTYADAGKRYMTSGTVSSNSRIELLPAASVTDPRTTIFYVAPDGDDNHLLSYGNGQYAQYTQWAAVGAESPATVTFSNNPNYFGTYLVNLYTTENNYLFGASGTATTTDDVTTYSFYMDKGNPYNAWEGYSWNLEEVTKLPVRMTSAGAATVYAPVALSVPEGVKAYTGEKYDDTTILLTQVAEIPAQTAVLIVADAAPAETSYVEFPIVESSATAPAANVFAGQITTHAKAEGDLTLGNSATTGVGFYQYSGTNIAGFTAYVPAGTFGTTAVRMMFGPDEVTAIAEAAIAAENGKEAYDLQGRRVARATNGVYVIGGKKVIVR